MRLPTRPIQSRQFTGIPASPGIQIAKVHLFDPVKTILPVRRISESEIKHEKAQLKQAIGEARRTLEQLREKVRKTLDDAHAAIFDPQLMLLEDPLLLETTHERIENHRETAALAFTTVIKAFADKFNTLTDEYIATRHVDIIDVGNRVCQFLTPASTPPSTLANLKDDVIVLAQDLSPSDTAQMDHKHVRGMATELGGPTSHSAILAKALEIPAVVGIGPFLHTIAPNSLAIIDGSEGALTLDPNPREVARSRSRRRRYMMHERDLKKLKNLPAETLDGYRVELSANVELPIEIPHVIAHGAEGVGLFRTEFLYLEKDRLPTEEEMFLVYREVLEKIKPHPVIIRTIDLGGDKLMTQLPTGRELNPFLGLRAIRLCLAFPEIFRTQLRAILRASAHGKAKIMFPMISSLREVRQAKEILESVRDEMRAEGLAFDEEIQVGIMIEIPSAAICADQLAKEVDFFSIGTNDLIQYTLAVDRGNDQVALLYDPFHPAILRLIRMTIAAAQREGIWVGLCGEMSSNPLCALLLVGLGIDELSMGALSIPEIKQLIRQIRLADARRVVEDVYSLRSSAEIHDYVRQAFRVLLRRRIRLPSSSRL